MITMISTMIVSWNGGNLSKKMNVFSRNTAIWNGIYSNILIIRRYFCKYFRVLISWHHSQALWYPFYFWFSLLSYWKYKAYPLILPNIRMFSNPLPDIISLANRWFRWTNSPLVISDTSSLAFYFIYCKYTKTQCLVYGFITMFERWIITYTISNAT